jgi:hypothetical protein
LIPTLFTHTPRRPFTYLCTASTEFQGPDGQMEVRNGQNRKEVYHIQRQVGFGGALLKQFSCSAVLRPLLACPCHPPSASESQCCLSADPASPPNAACQRAVHSPQPWAPPPRGSRHPRHQDPQPSPPGPLHHLQGYLQEGGAITLCSYGKGSRSPPSPQIWSTNSSLLSSKNTANNVIGYS